MEQSKGLATAISLMKMALALLDDAQEDTAAIHLQHAIDVATREPAMLPGDEISPELEARFAAKP